MRAQSKIVGIYLNLVILYLVDVNGFSLFKSSSTFDNDVKRGYNYDGKKTDVQEKRVTCHDAIKPPYIDSSTKNGTSETLVIFDGIHMLTAVDVMITDDREYYFYVYYYPEGSSCVESERIQITDSKGDPKKFDNGGNEDSLISHVFHKPIVTECLTVSVYPIMPPSDHFDSNYTEIINATEYAYENESNDTTSGDYGGSNGNIEPFDVSLTNFTEFKKQTTIPVKRSEVIKIAQVTAIGCAKSQCQENKIGLDDDDRFPDSVFTSSDNLPGHEPQHARFKDSAQWRPKNPKDSWLQVHFQSEKILTGIIVRSKGNQLKTFKLSYSRNCMSYFNVSDRYGEQKKFVLMDKEDQEIQLPSPIRSSCVRLHPVEYEKGVSVSIDFLGCGTGEGIAACGKSKYGTDHFDRRIINGIANIHGEWPWLVSLVISNDFSPPEHNCGGALIDPQWVLTAAHCVSERLMSYMEWSNSSLKIMLGESHYDVEQGTEHISDIDNIIVHPGYQHNGTWTLSMNDIALIKLTEPVVLSDYVNTICVPSEDDVFEDGDKVILSGWGMTNTTAGKDTKLGRHVDLILYNYERCAELYRAYEEYEGPGALDLESPVLDSVVCAGGPGVLQGGCYGDSGGPLLAKQGDSWVIIGVVSGGSVCGGYKVPGIFTRVQSFLEWIYDEINAN